MDYRIKFRKLLQSAYENSGFTSYRSLSNASDWSGDRIQKIFNGEFDASTNGPGFFGVLRVCESLGVTPNYVGGIPMFSRNSGESLDPQNVLLETDDHQKKPTVLELMRRYIRGGQRKEAFAPFYEFFDFYDLPDEETRTVKIQSMGEHSLSSRMTDNRSNPSVVQEAYNAAPKAFQEQIFRAHLQIARDGWTTQPDYIDQRMANLPKHQKFDYLRVGMRLTDMENNTSIAIYCELLPQ